MGESDTWLLIDGREKARYVVASKMALLLFPEFQIHQEKKEADQAFENLPLTMTRSQTLI